ncbi:MAG: TetR/AcrR family transcriptional regulator [Propionibacteriaceae bacterium]|nr:TetR/AcrR family transcriptional regulator [Propionibacteriaceae bacterium]
MSDLTARARIVDAAIGVFAEQGGAASVRAIATAAGVSPGLITHHFGTKEALKAECDQRVLDGYTEMKMAGIANPAGSMNLVNNTDPEQAEHISAMSTYMLRAFLEGGETAREFYRRLLAQMAEVIDAAAAQGMVRPECTDATHLRYMAGSTLGFMLVQFVLEPPNDNQEFFQGVTSDPAVLDAMLDTLTNGVFSNDQVLTAYRAANGGQTGDQGGQSDHKGTQQKKENNVQ